MDDAHDLRRLALDLQYALVETLPVLEEALKDPHYRAGAIKERLRRVKQVIAAAERELG